MNKNELRIGNTVYTVYANISGSVIESPVEYTIQSGADIDNAHWYFPIPLTPEILERLGFKVGKGKARKPYYVKAVNTKRYPYPNAGRIYLLERRGKYRYNNGATYGFTPEIEYVHTLMNLFYTLTGTELTLKP